MKKKIQISFLAISIMSLSFLNSKTEIPNDFQGGAAAALVGAATGDETWVVAGTVSMEISTWMAAVPGFQVVSVFGFL